MQQHYNSFEDMLGDYMSVMPDDPKITGSATLLEVNE